MTDVLSKGFGFYESYWTSVQNLPLEQQKEVFYAMVKYGITGDMVDPVEMPLGYALTMSNKQSIDNSVDRWEVNAQKATMKEDKKISREYQVQQLIEEGKTLREIAETIGMSESTVKRTKAWQGREKVKNSSKTGQNELKNELSDQEKTGQNELFYDLSGVQKIVQTDQNEQVMNSSNERSNEPKKSPNELFDF